MFTIRIMFESGLEVIHQATNVQSRPGTETLSGVQCVTWFEGNQGHDLYDEVDVYVMNENGKTVADYHLHYPQEIKERLRLHAEVKPAVVMFG